MRNNPNPETGAEDMDDVEEIEDRWAWLFLLLSIALVTGALLHPGQWLVVPAVALLVGQVITVFWPSRSAEDDEADTDPLDEDDEDEDA